MNRATYHQEIIQIDDQTIQAECGPMRLTIQAFKTGTSQLALARKAAKTAFSYLACIAGYRRDLCRPAQKITRLPDDRLARQMIISAQSIGDDDLTPMAAVAGTLADAVADWIYRHGASKVVVNNGGDIAIRMADSESVTVGIRTDIRRPDITYVLDLNGSRPTWGVTTSGFGGRSFTRGIASAVTVVADQASIADTAATAIANACTVTDAAIVRKPARALDPATDIPDIDVTVAIGPLPSEKKQIALNRALEKANVLVREKHIIGALLTIDGEKVITTGLQLFLRSLYDNDRNQRCSADELIFANCP